MLQIVRKPNDERPMNTTMKKYRCIFSKKPVPSWARLVGVLSVMGVSGCAVPVHQQRLVAQANMQFGDSSVFNYQSKLLTQTETGAAASGGAQAAGCTSCR